MKEGLIMKYRCVTTSVEGFVQQVAVSYLKNGYVFYAAGAVPERKDPRAVDAKLMKRYKVDISKWVRARRKRAGIAGVQYIRFRRFFLLLATYGTHRFFEEEGEVFRDARREPILCFGYSLSIRGGHPSVRIAPEEYRALKSFLLELARHRSKEALEAEFRSLPFEPYRPVRSRLLCILRAVNRVRRAAGFKPISKECVRWHRRIVRPFESVVDVGEGGEVRGEAGVGRADGGRRRLVSRIMLDECKAHPAS